VPKHSGIEPATPKCGIVKPNEGTHFLAVPGARHTTVAVAGGIMLLGGGKVALGSIQHSGLPNVLAAALNAES